MDIRKVVNNIERVLKQVEDNFALLRNYYG
jgi:hypothetical protein